MPDTGPLTEALEQIRRARGLAAAAFVPRLVKVVDEVLALADRLAPQGPPSSALEKDRAWMLRKCADAIRETITRELAAGPEDECEGAPDPEDDDA